VTGAAPLAAVADVSEPTTVVENRFLLTTVAFRRLLQIRGGSRPRVDVAGHKPTFQAVAEVRAGCVAYWTP
jgi:DNA-directed RNA polymerase subunit K/omega